MWREEVDFKILVGKTLQSVEVIDQEEIIFTTIEGEKFIMYHEQDYCESVSIKEIVGDLQRLIGSEILTAYVSQESGEMMYEGSCTWTFYNISTNLDTVNISWLGESNGYYSETVQFKQILEEKPKG